MTGNKIIIPVNVLKGQTIQPALAELVKDLDVVLVGIHVTPEQTAPGQAKEQFEEQAVEKLEDVMSVFEQDNGSIQSHVVFTQDRQKTINRLVDEHEAIGYVVPNPMESHEKVLLTYQHSVNPETRTKLLEIAEELFSDSEKIELIVFGGEEDQERQNAINAGINKDVLQVSTTDSIDSIGEVSREATDYDIVCMVEQQQALHGLIFGDEGERIARTSLNPLIVIRNIESNSE